MGDVLDDHDAFVAHMIANPSVFSRDVIKSAIDDGLTLREARAMDAIAWGARGGGALGARVRMCQLVRQWASDVDGRVRGNERQKATHDVVASVFDRTKAKSGLEANGGKTTTTGDGATKTSSAVVPPWTRPPGTRFIVDGFTHENARTCEHWILTHFHEDHYRGLTRTFDRGVVYATATTCALVRLKLGVESSRLRELELHPAKHRIDGVSVTLIDANHCPGAAMALFEFDDARRSVLHTGDFRFHEDMKTHPALLDASRRGVILILDTTYCAVEHAGIPSQAHVLKCVRDAVVTESVASSRKLFLFGAYTVGKEKVFFEAAKALKTKVYVGKTRRQVLECLPLTKEERESVTADDTRSNVHVVDMGSTSFKKMAAIQKYYKSRFDYVVAFKPTGWTFSAEKKNTRATSRRARGSLIQYSVPYSEHSSLLELREFVKFMKPVRVFPHVGNDRGENCARMMNLLTMPDEEFALTLEEHTRTNKENVVAAGKGGKRPRGYN